MNILACDRESDVVENGRQHLNGRLKIAAKCKNVMVKCQKVPTYLEATSPSWLMLVEGMRAGWICKICVIAIIWISVSRFALTLLGPGIEFS